MDNFFYIDNLGNQVGPRSIEQMMVADVLRPETMVWKPGYSDWMRADQSDDFTAFLATPSAHHQVPPQFSNPAAESYTPPVNPYNQQQQQRYQAVGGQYNTVQQPLIEKPHSWLVESIIATILCCLPFGVVGIVYGANADRYWNEGKVAEACKAAQTAKTMFWLSLGFGLFSGVLVFVLNIFGLFTGLFASSCFI